MQVDDICVVKESSTWDDGSLRGKTVIIDAGEGQYSVSEINGYGGGAWIPGNELEFVRHGTKEEREMVAQNKEEVHRMYSDLNWIKGYWPNFLEGISATSMLALFHAIGYHSPFELNGEYYALMQDWCALHPVFDALMNGDYDKAISETKKLFKPEFVAENIVKVDTLYLTLNPDTKVKFY